jgi:type I restriction enzyme R subunit
VFWHTQGSGKSLSMLWFTQKVLRRIPGSWTFVMVTDRTELDVQLHGEFADAGAMPARLRCTPPRRPPARAAGRRPPLRLHADPQVPRRREAGETTMPVLSDRSDVIVITDEAHRSQYDALA